MGMLLMSCQKTAAGGGPHLLKFCMSLPHVPAWWHSTGSGCTACSQQRCVASSATALPGREESFTRRTSGGSCSSLLRLALALSLAPRQKIASSVKAASASHSMVASADQGLQTRLEHSTDP
jgi:hypothetical protein